MVCKLPQGLYGTLSHRETEVVKAIAMGDPVKNAADKLGVTIGTAKVYLKSAYKKIGAHNKADVTAFALKTNLI
jgi:DNA-binding NarL/FixJ family response regulator